MARGKTELKLIESNSARQVTFSKRRNGILKKAFELSVLCSCEVAVIIYSQKGKLFEFGSNDSDVIKTIERYKACTNGNVNREPAEEEMQLVQRLQEEMTVLSKNIELLEARKRKFSGENLDGCSIDELRELENTIETGLRNVRLAKSRILEDEIEKLKEKNNLLTKENEELHEKFQLLPQNNNGNRAPNSNNDLGSLLQLGFPYYSSS